MLASAPGLVLVAGAGPTGLTAAVNLARFGIAVRIIDRASVPPPDRSRAAVVQPRTLEIFDNLGIADEAVHAGLRVGALRLYSPTGRHSMLRFAEPGWLDSRYDALLSLPQDQTERILTELLERQGIHVERGVELTALDQDESRVTATLQHTDGRAEAIAANYVVGADGAHSAVRQLAGLTFPGVTYHDEGLIGDIIVDWKLPHDEVSLCPRPDGFLLVFPLPGERHFRTIMIVPTNQIDENRHLDLAEFRERLEHMTPDGYGASGGRPTIVEARWLTRYRLHRRGVTTYSRGRVFVAGDAAHIHSPVGAQGMNTGIQDSYNLTWKLALVLRGQAPNTLLDTYNEERRRIGELLLNGTDKAFGFVAGHGWLSRTARRIAPTFAARVLNAPVLAKRLVRFVSQLAIKYPHSPLSVEAPGASGLGRGAPRAGDRAPDVPLREPGGEGGRLFDAFREPRHVLLVFEGEGNAASRSLVEAAVDSGARRSAVIAVRRVMRGPSAGAGEALLDVEGAAHQRYGAAGGAIYLVRPDGYIAFRGALSDAGTLEADLARRFTVPR